MLRSFDPRSGAHPHDVEDPYYGTHDDFEDVFDRHRGLAARVARLGRRTTRRPGNGRLMAQLHLPAQAPVAGALRDRHRLRLPVLHRAGAVAARQEHQDVPRERPDLLLPVRRSGAGDRLPAAPGFGGTERCRGDGSPPPAGITRTPRCWPGSGWSRASRRSRCWCRSPSTAGRPCWWTAATCGRYRVRMHPRCLRCRRGTVTHHRAAARFRTRRRRQGTVPPERRAAGVLHQHRPDLGADRDAVGRLIPAARRRSARRPRRDPVAAPRRGPVPVLRHPVDRVRHHRTDRRWLLRARRGSTTPPREGRGRLSARRRKPLTTRREARRPLRQAAADADRAHRREQLHRPRQPHRGAQVGRFRDPTVAERRPDLEAVRVLRRPAKPDAQRAGEGGLRHPGVGAGVLWQRHGATRPTPAAASRR